MFLIEFDAAALFIHAINMWHFACQKRVPDGSNRYYIQLMMLAAAAAAASICLAAAFSMGQSEISPAIPYLYSLYSALRILILLTASLYFINHTVGSSARMLLTAFCMTVCIIALAMIIPAAANHLPGLRYPESHPLYISIRIGMLGMCVFFVEKNRSWFSRSAILFFSFAVLILFASSYADAINPQLVTGNFSIALSVLIIQLSIIDNSDMIDAQTGLINAKGLRYLLREAFRKDHRCTLIVVGSTELQGLKGYIDALSMQAMTDAFCAWLTAKRGKKVRLCIINDGLFVFFCTAGDAEAQRKTDYEALLFAEKLGSEGVWNWRQNSLSIDIPFRTALLHCPQDCAAVDTVEDYLEQFFDLPDLNNNRDVFFASDFQQGKRERDFAVTEQLNTLLSQHTIELRFQPIVSIVNQKATAIEAIAGATLDSGEWIWQSELYRIADKIGLGNRLFDTILYESCKWYSTHTLELPGVNQLQIRLPGSKCIGVEWASDIRNTAERARIPLKNLCLEITEPVVLGAQQTIIPNILKLIEQGVSFAIDDFGSGYSDYGKLFELPFNTVKLDKKVLHTGAIDIRRARLLQGTFTMFKKKNMRIICEGVESAREASMLSTLGCTEMQGFLFGAPQPGERILEQLRADA